MNETPNTAPDDSAVDPLVRGERLDLETIRARLEGERGDGFWRSLDEIAETTEFVEFMRKEFPRQAAPLESALDRRSFLKLLGASMALAGLSACARPPAPRETIVPYVRQPEDVVPGRPLYFATAISEGGYAEGVLAESHQGRPTRVEGNPDHPASLGAAAPAVSATVLSLYDPDRSQGVRQSGNARSWSQYVTALRDALEASGDGSGVRFLTENVTSPTVGGALLRLLEAYPEARWHQWDASRPDAPVAGARLAFGEDVAPVFDLGNADVVVSFDADFTNRGPGRLRYARDLARRRRVRSADDDMNRLWLVESHPTPTGSIADHRLPLAPADIAALAAWVATELGVTGAPTASLPERVPRPWADALIDDLRSNAGRSLVLAGPEQAPVVHALAHAINDLLGNVGSTVRYIASPEVRPELHGASLRALSDEMHAGTVDVLVVVGANPAYTAPAALRFDEAMGRVATSFHLGQSFDETAALATWHAPQAHVLETWGDVRAFDGSVTITQPLFSPFYGGRSELELLAGALGDEGGSAFDIVRSAWRDRVEGDFDTFWQRALYRGVVDDSASPERSVTLQVFEAELPTPSELVLHVMPDPSLGDGRHANNGWLQELPQPFTKLTWDNVAVIAPATAEALGVTKEDLLAISTADGEVTLPVWVQPGQAQGVISTTTGYGRRAAGRVGNGVGVDLAPIRSLTGAVTRVTGATRARGRHRLATTQPHHNLDGTGERRHIVRAGTLTELRAEPDYPTFVHPVAHHESDIFPDWEYNSYQWGMVIDMTVCTGCNACVTACQSENNIPIVGKDQVLVGREMHWIRVDAYHRGGIDDPEFFHMPMACQHCEKAPCEPVCPVAATVHDSEGLNVMVYNRCVGTRYCANNCPYKVRRFNYLQYAELSTDATELSLANNPDVTVRSRGVMEKCTYCTQRISGARIDAHNQGRRIRDGEVVTACQSACPTEAIVFGDLADETSRVSEAKRSVLDYALLEELNTVPRTTYLARVSNPHPALAENGSA
ncbi:MAG: 4Fe-4S dicluster domain-containing protein [Trueperaceae bacterium]|nr:MAG: 4Fe-4S dicluster domain-containing protein [Trueperaceae bacterium]